MLSHNVYDTTSTPRLQYSQSFRVRNKRQSYPRNQNYGNQNNQNNANNLNNRARQYADTNIATSSPYLPGKVNPIKEEGVVSFRSNKDEAIQIARVLVGVIAGLAGADAKTQAKDILKAIRPLYDLPAEYDKAVDPVMMVTLADLYGVGTRSSANDQKKYYYGLSGRWADQSCTTNYGINGITQTEFNNSRNYVQATRAEIRGGIDGYKIGTALSSLLGTRGVSDINKLRLSQILRAYYSKPQSQINSGTFSVSYCDRTSQINIQDVENQANVYAAIVSIYKSMVWPPQLNQDFKSAFTASQSIGKNLNK